MLSPTQTYGEKEIGRRQWSYQERVEQTHIEKREDKERGYIRILSDQHDKKG